MGEIRVATGDPGGEGALLEDDFAEGAAGAPGGDEVDGVGQVGRWFVAWREDEGEAQARVFAEEGRQQLPEVAAAADVGLLGEPAVDGDVERHGGIVAWCVFNL